ncbi:MULTISPECIES: helix-turn-helix domain-containing protein [unclassified Caballeronia]|uniref:helix-turn-helix domain-containing protein n=1 Tax=unclassified Caballeronia TaxID=2646786 RepID=UPI002866B46F|nr:MULTISPECIES: helix-turn-helix domain-containing protein [unclassified Caballeronia]MDR5816480.1 helix-turn-helix domain-containing protein [Caballeronia sp. LZ033]MDR5823151.1 helix-turn-helix domain-containing protein [Caballeronia sp. LZ043]
MPKHDNRSHVSGSAKNGLPPPPVARALRKLGADLALARRRRRLTQASMAERIQTSVATLRRLEHGDARIPIGLIARAFMILGELDKIDGLLDTASDEIGLTLMNQELPQRIRKKRITPESGAL